MDMSKLPKLSKTDPPPATAADDTTPSAQVVDYARAADPSFSGGEIWFNLIVGVIFLLLGRGFGGYAWAKITHQPHHTFVNWTSGPNSGQEVAYRDLEGNVFLNESALFLFGVAILLDCVTRIAIRRGSRFGRPLAYMGLGVTAGATAYNLYASLVFLKGNVLPFLSLMAAAFGGYVVFHQWHMVKILNRAKQLP
jgi:hypothetical protein